MNKYEIITPGMRGHISADDLNRSRRIEQLMNAGGEWGDHRYTITLGKLTFSVRELHTWSTDQWTRMMARAQAR